MTDPQQPEQPSGGPGSQAEGLAEGREEAGKAAAPNTEAQGARANGMETKVADVEGTESKSSEVNSSEAGSTEATSTSAGQPDAKSAEPQSADAEASKSEASKSESSESESSETGNAEAKPAAASGPAASDVESKSPVPSTPAASSAAAGGSDAKDSGSQSKKDNKGLLIGLSAAALVIVVLVLAAFVWPGFLAGPGKPDAKATEAAAALGSKDAGRLDKVACHGPDGKSTGQLPPQVLQLIQSAAQTGPPVLTLDTQARVPVDLTLSAQGQTQKIPVDLVLGVTNHAWCMDGIAQRQ